ncbi:MAG: DNA-binding protein [Chitinophagaceae bacterium]|nr:DNA-binding protein [Chitinophagaceae bacterium]
MEVICLENEAFYALIEEVVQRLKEKNNIQEDKWISGEEAMQKMRIKSKSTLQRLRDEGRVRFTQPDKKNILYDTDSINEYLEKHAKETF